MAVARLTAGERKQAIVEAAIRLFSEKGFHGVTTRELAQAVGVSEPVLYQHYQTKRELYAAIIEHKSAQVEAKVCQLNAPISDLSAPDTDILFSVALNIAVWHEEDRSLSRLLLYSALEGQEFSDMFFARHASLFFDMLKRYFEHRIQEGTFRQVDPVACSWAFIGMVAHHSETLNLYHFDPYPQPKEVLLGKMVDLFLNGITTDSTEIIK
jgi:AcrR family transcriptional regulator